MRPVRPTTAQADAWTAVDGALQRYHVIGGPEEGPDVEPCPALVSQAGLVHVAYRLDELELVDLAQGGTLWLTTWGQLPVHQLLVEPPPARQ